MTRKEAIIKDINRTNRQVPKNNHWHNFSPDHEYAWARVQRLRMEGRCVGGHYKDTYLLPSYHYARKEALFI